MAASSLEAKAGVAELRQQLAKQEQFQNELAKCVIGLSAHFLNEKTSAEALVKIRREVADRKLDELLDRLLQKYGWKDSGTADSHTPADKAASDTAPR